MSFQRINLFSGSKKKFRKSDRLLRRFVVFVLVTKIILERSGWMAKRRANGKGSIRKRKDGRWEGRFTAAYNPATGKQIFKNVLGKTQAEVKEKLKKAMEEAQGWISRTEPSR